jgi:hypothetical protein
MGSLYGSALHLPSAAAKLDGEGSVRASAEVLISHATREDSGFALREDGGFERRD